MDFKLRNKPLKTVMSLLLLALVSMGLIALMGCATADTDQSDLPWNTPQPWESSPTIPGINDQGY
ncbi:MAG: hypothetical protein V2A34_07325 [Lentisphaerota bacterium]